MDENKTKYDANRASAVKWCAKKYGVTRAYVRMIINSQISTGRSEDIRRDFFKKYEALKQVLS